MKRAYIVAAVLFVLLMAGIVAVRKAGDTTTSAKSGQSAGMPVPASSGIPEKEAVVESPSPKDTMTPKRYSNPPAMSIDPSKTYTATLTTDKGAIVVRLYAKDTPITVNNFVFLAREGFYSDTVFHRIIKGFMIQGGDPQGTGTGSPGYRFADEPITRDYTRGVMAMANSGPDTNGSQFFIMHSDNPLPKNYVIFGAIDPADTASLATLDAIAGVPVTDNGMGEVSKPVTPVVLQSVTVVEK